MKKFGWFLRRIKLSRDLAHWLVSDWIYTGLGVLCVVIVLRVTVVKSKGEIVRGRELFVWQ